MTSLQAIPAFRTSKPSLPFLLRRDGLFLRTSVPSFGHFRVHLFPLSFRRFFFSNPAFPFLQVRRGLFSRGSQSLSTPAKFLPADQVRGVFLPTTLFFFPCTSVFSPGHPKKHKPLEDYPSLLLLAPFVRPFPSLPLFLLSPFPCTYNSCFFSLPPLP